MQGIIDILASDINVIGESDFTANSGVLDVLVNNVGVNGAVFRHPDGRSYFSLGDNLNIQKIWAVVNWGFGAGGPNGIPDTSHNIGMALYDGANFELLPPFTNATRSLYIPTLCHPVEFPGIYSKMPIAGARRQIRLTRIELRISQVNLPAPLDGQRIVVQYFMQIQHTLLMELNP